MNLYIVQYDRGNDNYVCIEELYVVSATLTEVEKIHPNALCVELMQKEIQILNK